MRALLEIGGLRRHVVELGEGAGVVNAPAIVLLHGAGWFTRPLRATYWATTNSARRPQTNAR